ncbi:hypothetical protein D0U02_31425 [Burkholderia pseudomallei]|nr:hypothetical protein EGY15_20405 [Burkholderia pseudomallei]RFS50801.1 hypothetical protein D0U05_25945 [Burkholderia pseudomallei]RFS53612.1 hypothetical protein D0U01_33850 [Burkholderia pseudomallei]RFS53879.1 hypothetical protein D0U02_31425 [Burkholderia pseudomallei]RFS65184.1 hypothetical protein D0T98_36080 [Burkholderia pseudomallei]
MCARRVAALGRHRVPACVFVSRWVRLNADQALAPFVVCESSTCASRNSATFRRQSDWMSHRARCMRFGVSTDPLHHKPRQIQWSEE